MKRSKRPVRIFKQSTASWTNPAMLGAWNRTKIKEFSKEFPQLKNGEYSNNSLRSRTYLNFFFFYFESWKNSNAILKVSDHNLLTDFSSMKFRMGMFQIGPRRYITRESRIHCSFSSSPFADRFLSSILFDVSLRVGCSSATTRGLNGPTVR